MRRKMIALACIAASLALALPGVPIGAATRPLSVSPEVGVRGTIPGRTVEEKVTLDNLSDTGFNISATLTPLEVGGNGELSSVDGGSSLPSAASWGFVEPNTFLLARGHSQELKVVFTPPSGTRAQGYYAAVRLVGTTPSGARTTVTHKMLLEVGGEGLERSARVAGISAPARSFGTSIPVSVRLENTGNVAVMASGTVRLRDALSRVTASIDVPRTPVIPGHPRTLRYTIPAPIVPGDIRVSADIGFGEGLPRDSASTTALAIAWWHAAVAALVLFVLVRLVLALVRRLRRRKAAKRRARATVAAPEPARTNGIPAAPSRVAARSTRILADDELQSFWEDEPSRGYEPVPETEHEPEPAAVGREPEPEAFAPEPQIFVPEPEEEIIESEPFEPEPFEPAPAAEAWEPPAAVWEPPAAVEVEPRPEPAPEPVVLSALPVAEPEPSAAEPVAEEAVEAAGARVSHLVDRVKAGIPAGPPGGPQARLRRVRVALELMTERGAGSGERIDVGLSLLRWARGDEVVRAVEEAFDAATLAGKKSAVAALALAMAEVRSPRSLEALLRAYAAAPRTFTKRLRDTMHSYPLEEFRDRGDLLAALPADRRSALKVG